MELYSLSEKEFTVLTGIYGFRKKLSFPSNDIIDVKKSQRERLLYARDALRYSVPQKLLLIYLKDKLSIEKHKEIIKFRDSIFTSVFRIHNIGVNDKGDMIYLTKQPKGGFESILYAIKEKVKQVEPVSLKKSSSYRKIAIAVFDLVIFFSNLLILYYIHIYWSHHYNLIYKKIKFILFSEFL